jgi:3-methyladenine DNA glycosylase AlkD
MFISLNMFTANRFSIFQRFLIRYTQKNKTSSVSSSSSWSKLDSTMKKLIDSKQYRKALNLFDEQSETSSDIAINLALKACTQLNDHQRGIHIGQQLSSKSLKDPFIQTSLIHLYSKSLIH